MIANSQALRDAREKISRRIFELLGLTLGGHHDAPLVPDAPHGIAADDLLRRKNSLITRPSG
jgi:hypothetical protein